MKYPTFKAFLVKNWWFLLLGFAKAFNNSETSDMTGSPLLDFVLLFGFLLLVMFVYWLIRYKIRKT